VWPPVDDVAYGLITEIWYDVSCRLTCDCYSCVNFFLTTYDLCGVSVLSLYAPLIRLTSLRG
jgi:hypothetical protein